MVFFRKHGLVISGIIVGLSVLHSKVMAVEFNTDMLDDDTKSNIDLSRFSQAGYIMPGSYTLSLKVNESNISDVEVSFYEHNENKNLEGASPVEVCIKAEQLPLIGLKPELLKDIRWWHDAQCADFSAIEGVSFRGDLSESALYMAVPQAWLEYSDANWLPPSRWEEGEPGVILDYNLTGTVTNPEKSNTTTSVSGNGTAGVNLGAWRFRGDYQGQYNRTADSQASRSIDWSQIYAYRALPSITSKLLLGETYISSDIFDSWRFTGLSLATDERMLPPKLRGYAPEVKGIAKTNARVVISQKGRVLYQTSVAAGPFSVQELSSATNGQLDVRVEEQDGSVQTFTVNTATIPYLTRPGQVRYKLAAGRPSDYSHSMIAPMFAAGEFSWGISNAWSLYGGSILSEEYDALSLGVGRDLFFLGAISADVTQSVANIRYKERYQGKSWRLSYSKHFDDFNSDITFAGYRFSERGYLSMAEYLDIHAGNDSIYHNKELYTITSSKSFPDLRLSAYFSYNHQTYWNKKSTDYYNFSLSQYVNIGNWKDISVTLNATRNKYNEKWNDAVFISLSMPFSNGTISYNGTYSDDRYTQAAGYYQRLENGDSYRVNAGTRSGNGENLQPQVSGFYTHRGDTVNMTANTSWVESSYQSAGVSLQGGMTATPKGAALHPGGTAGGARMMVSTDGVSGVPINSKTHTNYFGIGVITDVGNYYRTVTRVDINNLDDDVETSGSPVKESALTEGAIGFRSFAMLKGAKTMAVISTNDGRHPPFGASIFDSRNRELGIVGDSGNVWLAGINAGDNLFVHWGGVAQCEVILPQAINTEQSLLLPCYPISGSEITR